MIKITTANDEKIPKGLRYDQLQTGKLYVWDGNEIIGRSGSTYVYLKTEEGLVSFENDNVLDVTAVVTVSTDRFILAPSTTVLTIHN